MIQQPDLLTLDDLDACLALARDRAWPAEERKWRLLFQVGTVYGVRDRAGQLIGTTILTRFGHSLSVISMVLVATCCGGRGIGRALMARALADAVGTTTFLYATPLGRPLYEKLGFVAAGTLHTYVGRVAAVAHSPLTRAAGPADLSAIVDLDAGVNGVERPLLLQRLEAFVEQMRVIERARVITGYGAVWRNIDHLVIGPLVADNAGDAEALVRELAHGADLPVRLDVDDRHEGMRTWVEGEGLRPRNSTTMMIRGASHLPGDRSRWFGPVMQALG